jgi:predicted nucleic acid-binding protein
MKFFFDTSVLLPVFVDDHIHHEASLAVFKSTSGKNAYCAAHSLAELFSSLTRMPGPFRARPEEAMLLLEGLHKRFSLVVLQPPEYWSTIRQCSEARIVGGTVYDALIARCAIKSGADVIYTWNVADFQRLGAEVARRLRTP